MTQPTSIPLAAVLDTAAAGPLRLSLRKAIQEAAPVSVDGGMVDRVGLACLQVLAAAKWSAEEAGVAFRIDGPSSALADMAALCGLRDLVSASA